jgi:hypothetical protein
MPRQNDLSEPVYWRGRQWAVTGYGLETIGEPYHYFIEAARLGSRGHGGPDHFSVLRHLLEKGWCDREDLAEAYRQAIRFHKQHFRDLPTHWEAMIQKSLRKVALLDEFHARTMKYLPRRQSADGLYGAVSADELAEAFDKAMAEQREHRATADRTAE